MRNYIRKTDRVKVPSDLVEKAVAIALDEEKSVTSVANLFDIPRRSLTRYVKKKKKMDLEQQNMPESVSPTNHGYLNARQVTV